MRKLAVFMLAMAAAAPVLAEPSAPASAPAAGANPNEIICRTMPVIGSRLGRTRQCATRAEWQRMQSAEQESTRNALRQGVQPQCMSVGEQMRAAGRYAGPVSAVGASCQ